MYATLDRISFYIRQVCPAEQVESALNDMSDNVRQRVGALMSNVAVDDAVHAETEAIVKRFRAFGDLANLGAFTAEEFLEERARCHREVGEVASWGRDVKYASWSVFHRLEAELEDCVNRVRAIMATRGDGG